MIKQNKILFTSRNYLYALGISILMFSGCAVKNENKEIAKIPSGNEITSLKHKDILSETTIHDAVRINDPKLVDFFIEEKVDLNSKDRFGYTPLHLAARFNHLDIAKKLIKNGATVNTTDKYGDTPLIDSSRNGYSSMSKLLICNEAKRDVVDKYDMSPLHYASKTNDLKIAKLLRSKDIKSDCSAPKARPIPTQRNEFYNLIAIDDYKIINDNTPKICGDILDQDVRQVQITFDGGQSVTDAVINENRWCAEVEETITNGDYLVMAMAINSAAQRGKAQDDLTIEVSTEVSSDIFSALKDEFSKDLKNWNAELLEESLIVRFKNPAQMFTRGSSEIRTEYRNILDSFFPRYLEILKKYDDEIASVYIQGHTSSRYRTAKTEEEKFEKNRILSQKRANSVLNYISNMSNPIVVTNDSYINDLFIPEGKSSSNLILNEDGTENVELSRRVEFRIEKR